MSELTKEQMEANKREIEYLASINARSLPDSPSRQGYSSKQIKEKLYQGEFYLLSKIQNGEAKIGEIESILDKLGIGIESTDYVIPEVDK